MTMLTTGELQPRSLDLGDLETCIAIEQVAHAYPWSKAQMLSALQRNGGWALESDSELIAFAIVSKVLEEAELLNFVVEPRFQGRGVGTCLLQHVLERLRSEEKLERFYLEVRESNIPALSLYQAAGFAEVGIRKAYYPAPGGREDAILMAMQIL